jgi:CMP-N-acetylneuraminic acid synthetase
MSYKEDRTLCIIIPFRFGNQDLPDKNIIRIHDKFLFERSLNHALHLKNFLNVRICLSTNRPSVLQEVKNLSKLFDLSEINKKRNSELFLSGIGIDLHRRSEALSSKSSLISETLENIRKSYNDQNIIFDNWLLLQPTSPFRNESDFRVLVKYLKLHQGENHHSLISVKRVDGNHPARMYLEKNNKLVSLPGMSKFSRYRRQDLERIYKRDGAFYLFSDSLAKKSKLFSNEPDFFVRDYPWNIDIDSQYDLAAALSINKLEVINDPNNT